MVEEEVVGAGTRLGEAGAGNQKSVPYENLGLKIWVVIARLSGEEFLRRPSSGLEAQSSACWVRRVDGKLSQSCRI